MGLLWSMQAETGPATHFTAKKDQFSISLQVFREDQEVTSKNIVRLRKSPEVHRIPIQENGLVGTLFLPPSTKPLPVIVVVSGAGGGIMEGKSQLLASHGFAVFALGYFRVEGLPPTLQNIPLEYFEAAFNWIKSQYYLDSSHVGIMGGSRGGELALILGSWFPESVQAIVAVVPSSTIYSGEDENEIGVSCDAWLYQGKPLAPFAHQPQIDDVLRSGKGHDRAHPLKFSEFFLQGMEDREAFEAAAIPVEKIRAPLLMISGADDQLWPSALYVSLVEERLQKHHTTFLWRHLCYPKAGHLIAQPLIPMVDNVNCLPPDDSWVDVGGSKGENWHACQDSWGKLIAFFEETLKKN